MNIIDIIEKKKHSEELSEEEIKYLIDNYVNGNIPDYQMSALLMAIYFNKLNIDETYFLTKSMVLSGETIKLDKVKGIKVDKHSTGGVGDSVTLVLGPLMASVGLVFAKMSGRGLGHTGGTLDKLESIPGFNISLTDEEFINNLNESHIAVIGQTADIVPADKLLYALRDATATVDNVSLISSSILSKKIALANDALVLDVKVGKGAFMKDVESATELSKLMVELGKKFNRKTKAIITNMNEPLGKAIGNSLEVIEAIETLRGEGPKALEEISVTIGSKLMHMCGKTEDEEEAKNILHENLRNGKAIEKFKEMVKLQGGDISYIDNTKKFELSKIKCEIYSNESGYVKEIDALEIGIASRDLGAGRLTKEDKLDLGAGILLNKKIGDYVNEGELLATLYTNKEDVVKDVAKRIEDAFSFSDDKENYELILKEID
ncbi:pyrimidine-nucleoside phosphorylase [Peptoniphilus sp.]|uniref:pyrimidine-nucleoside phosphorylase n=1 Tax=Peptoniphilus sp. TaxID=1971214 RepID=UPI003D8BD351